MTVVTDRWRRCGQYSGAMTSAEYVSGDSLHRPPSGATARDERQSVRGTASRTGGPLRVVMWGTYDVGKPRNRIVRDGLRGQGVEVIECHADVWSDIEDKSQVTGGLRWFFLLARWLLSYPRLIGRYLRLPDHDAVLIGYPGQLDVLVLWLFAKWRGKPVVLDVLMSFYAAIVDDRRLVGRWHPLALMIYAWEWLACRAADRTIVNSRPGADFWARRFGHDPRRFFAAFTGSEDLAFPPRATAPRADHARPFTALFYGTMLPSHGVKTIIEAARLAKDDPIDWIIIGDGQEGADVEAMLNEVPLARLRRITWVPYTELVRWIHTADVCLGIFADSHRAGLTIPNKIFQILSAGTPIVTRDGVGIRELLSPDMPGVHLVPPADPGALVDAVRGCLADREKLAQLTLHRAVAARFDPAAVARRLVALMESVVHERQERRWRQARAIGADVRRHQPTSTSANLG